ncbi:MAG: hypothetical protein HGB11_01540 [Chlorobiales bacterium]|nr:hypothetical protein [Chlorobiales bacterium]
MTHLKFVLFISLIAILSTSCSTDFEDGNISFSSDGKITRTDSQGNILDEDTNDWKIQKYFQGDVFIDQKPYSNPTTNGIVSLTLRYSTVVPEGAVYFMGINTNDLPVQLFVDTNPSFGSHVYTLNLTTLAPSLTALKGKQFRIRIYDGPGRLISYGDIEVSN